MTDLVWPSDIAPFRVSFFLQPHIGGAESPLTRSRKVYELSKPRWICRMTFRGGTDGFDGLAAYGPMLDSLIVQLKGGANRVAIWDFRRPYPIGLLHYYSLFAGELYTFTGGETFSGGERFRSPIGSEPFNEFADEGATAIWFKGLQPGQRVFNVGDYFGGDDRVHIIHNNADADGDGRAMVTFDPPLERALTLGAAVTMQPTSFFRLANPDGAGNQGSEIGTASVYELDFIEDLR